jgi:sigma-B regulation protein RsbU (phosphoserine phosphatase)
MADFNPRFTRSFRWKATTRFRQPLLSLVSTNSSTRNTPPEKYATFYCAIYDDRKNSLLYTNAGHLAPILIRDRQASRLESTGTVVGIFPAFPFEQAAVELQPGDLLAAFTDGITESENAHEEQFGEERLIELLLENADRPLNDIIQLVMDTVGGWAHDPSARDDITMLLARKV